ncbi:MAG: YggS family pyridoxal phosphate-dependent enzyme [Synechococcaceae cyanobacterium RM1_1_27]|nr:YggS family pyridoxal phosphate-dependent enzyme [Synechococcaceae cyanobacterium RM1_1_27]
MRSNSALIRQRIEQIRAGIPGHIQIMAVSKGYGVAHIKAAYEAGLRHFGESRIQEAQPKIKELQHSHPDITWHLIGHLQSNKAKAALELFDWIDSVDSLKLAQALDQRAQNQRAQNLTNPPALSLQIKLAPDPDKYGWTEANLWEQLPDLSQLQALAIRGVLTILPLGLQDPEVEALFQSLPRLAQELSLRSGGIIQPTVISMGMSGDYPLAIKAGSTQIRLGRSLFADA